jgi:hypothetical protein
MKTITTRGETMNLEELRTSIDAQLRAFDTLLGSARTRADVAVMKSVCRQAAQNLRDLSICIDQMEWAA